MKKILFSILIMMSCANIYATIGEPGQEIGEKAPLSTYARALEMNRDFPPNIIVENKTSISLKEITATFGITLTNTANESTQGSCNVTLKDLACKTETGLVSFTKSSILKSAIRKFSQAIAQEQGQGLSGAIVSVQSVYFTIQGGHLEDVVHGKNLTEKVQRNPFTFDYNNFQTLYSLKEVGLNLCLTLVVSENN